MAPKPRKFRIHPFLWALYHTLRAGLSIPIRVYFRRLTVLGRENLRKTQGPIIIALNHPSTLMDVLVPSIHIPRVMFFLANYGLFRHPVSNWLLRRLYTIPVKRKEDMAEGEERNNEDAFRQSYQHLARGGALFIAPEGVSWMNRFVRPFKTGTARIALGAEQQNNGALGVRILPIGMSYSAPHLFRSDLVMNIGEPIEVGAWLPQWATEPVAAAEDLTLFLEKTIRSLAIHTGDERGEKIFTRLETALHRADPMPLAKEFYRSQAIAARIVAALPTVQDDEVYYQSLEKEYLAGKNPFKKGNMGEYALLVIGFPLFLVGMAFWFLPCFIPWWLNKKLGLYIGYSSTIKLLTGMLITFPAMIGFVYWAGKPWWSAWWQFPAVLCSFILLGLFCERYLARFKVTYTT